MTDHISPDRFKLAVGIAYSAFCEREHRRGGHRLDDMAAAITAALPDLLADRDATVAEAREMAELSWASQVKKYADLVDSYQQSIDDVQESAAERIARARARAEAATGQLAAVAALLAKYEAWTGDRDYEWKSSPLDRERLRAVLDDPDGALRVVKADAWDSGRSFGYQDAQAYHGNGVIGAGCGPDSWDCDCTNPYRAASHDGSPT